MWRIPFEIGELQEEMIKQVQHINIKWNLTYTPLNILNLFDSDIPSPSSPQKKARHVSLFVEVPGYCGV